MIYYSLSSPVLSPYRRLVGLIRACKCISTLPSIACIDLHNVACNAFFFFFAELHVMLFTTLKGPTNYKIPILSFLSEFILIFHILWSWTFCIYVFDEYILYFMYTEKARFAYMVDLPLVWSLKIWARPCLLKPNPQILIGNFILNLWDWSKKRLYYTEQIFYQIDNIIYTNNHAPISSARW